MVTRLFLLVCLANAAAKGTVAQSNTCTLTTPFFHMHFGKGNVRDVNPTSLALYNRVSSSCPTDGHYTFASSTSECFHGDWHTLPDDHTPGDVEGNMLLVNSAYDKGVFLDTRIKGFKSETTYQFGVWLMNVCKPSRKCPFPLLPNLTILLQTPAGKTIAKFVTGDLPRQEVPQWILHRAQFTVPPSVTELILTLVNNAPGGCGNDFALDDITFRECLKPNPANVVEAKKIPPVAVKKQQPVTKKEVKKAITIQLPVKKRSLIVTVTKNERKVPASGKPIPGTQPVAFVPVPLILKQRTNSLIKQIKTTAGEILLDLYDNAEIDGDTVSIYHNNTLIASKQRLSQKPISLRIRVDKMQPHHELIMVANNLGSIPPNTSLMIVTTKDKQYQVFISSTEQQNAKVVIDLEE
jgi:hypothetical protein